MQQPRRTHALRFFVLALLALTLSACPSPSAPVDPGEPVYPASVDYDVSVDYAGWSVSGSALYYRTYEPARNEDLAFSVSGVPMGKKAWLVITNADEGESFRLSGGLANAPSARSALRRVATPVSRSASEPGKAKGIIRDIPAVSAFNADPWSFVSRSAPPSRSAIVPEPRASAVNQNVSFKVWTVDGASEFTADVPSTCRKVVGPYGVTLALWVADALWDGTLPYEPGKVNPDMLTAIADKFLLNGSDNDIFDWTSGIFGDYYSTPAWSGFIDNPNAIDILIADIHEQDSPTSGVIGYFHSLHNFKKTISGAENSNERIMFFLDAPMLVNTVNANGVDDGIWSPADFYPLEIYATLAHELQHMIHYNEKVVERNSMGSESWFDELCSASAEDFISVRLQQDGPRGVGYAIGASGPADNGNGHLPQFVFFPEDSLSYWYGDGYDYSMAYAIAAWLGRSDGAGLFSDLVQSSLTGFDALLSEFDARHGGGYTRTGFLRDWALANIASSLYIELPSVGSPISGTVRLYEGMSMTVVVER